MMHRGSSDSYNSYRNEEEQPQDLSSTHPTTSARHFSSFTMRHMLPQIPTRGNAVKSSSKSSGARDYPPGGEREQSAAGETKWIPFSSFDEGRADVETKEKENESKTPLDSLFEMTHRNDDWKPTGSSASNISAEENDLKQSAEEPPKLEAESFAFLESREGSSSHKSRDKTKNKSIDEDLYSKRDSSGDRKKDRLGNENKSKQNSKTKDNIKDNDKSHVELSRDNGSTDNSFSTDNSNIDENYANKSLNAEDGSNVDSVCNTRTKNRDKNVNLDDSEKSDKQKSNKKSPLPEDGNDNIPESSNVVNAQSDAGKTEPVNDKAAVEPAVPAQDTSTSEGQSGTTGGVVLRPKMTGRAKTNAELKKQLLEKRATGQKMKGDGGSQCSSPASHTEEQQTSSSPGMKWVVDETGAKYNVGDMLWGRVTGHPFWPCMVSPDPAHMHYTRLMPRGSKPSVRQYHVQFFGDQEEHGWVLETSTINFEGRKSFEKHCNQMIKVHKKDKKIYVVSSQRRKTWEKAVSSAEEAAALSRPDRIERYMRIYAAAKSTESPHKSASKHALDKSSSSKTASKSSESSAKSKPAPQSSHGSKEKSSDKSKTAAVAKRRHSGNKPDGGSTTSSPAGKRRRVGSSEDHVSGKKQSVPSEGEEMASPGGTSSTQSHQIQYAVFCLKRRESLKAECGGEMSEGEVEEKLKQEWGELGDDMRSRYIPMGSDMKHITQMRAAAAAKEAQEKAVASPGTIAKLRERKMGKLDEKSLRRKSRLDDESSDGSSSDDSDDGKKRRKSRSSQHSGSHSKPKREGTDLSGVPPKKRVMKSGRASPSRSQGESGDEEEDKKKKKPSKPYQVTPVAAAPGPVPALKVVEDGNVESVDMCDVCEKPCGPPNVVYCDGPCKLGYHPACIGLAEDKLDADFFCKECREDKHTCYTCKKKDSSTVRCTEPDCGRFYHADCLAPRRGLKVMSGVKDTWDDVETGLKTGYCPWHVCRTCIIRRAPNAAAADDEAMYQCIRCPTAYHVSDYCLPAGSHNIAGLRILCARHHEELLYNKTQTVSTANWCFTCERGGGLIHCQTCPIAYHRECMPRDCAAPRAVPGGVPVEDWRCKRCLDGIEILYGDIVWVKFGSYRWWPGEVWLSRYVPQNIQMLPHTEGEFPVCFFGSRDYLWTSKARSIPFIENDKCSKETTTRGIPKTYIKAVGEATQAYRAWVKAKSLLSSTHNGEKSTGGGAGVVTDASVASSLIKSGIKLIVGNGNVEKKKRLLPSSEKKRSSVDKTSKKGSSSSTLVDKESKRISSVTLTDRESRRSEGIERDGKSDRESKKESESGDKEKKKSSTSPSEKSIKKKSKSSSSKETTEPSMKSSSKVKPVTSPVKSSKTSRDADRKVKSPQAGGLVGEGGEKMYDSTCYRCGEVAGGGGVLRTLIHCDKAQCTRSYHLNCLNVTKLPHGRWLCPWHYCAQCGHNPKRQCSRCPNSYCEEHLTGNIDYIDSGELVCSLHGDQIINNAEISNDQEQDQEQDKELEMINDDAEESEVFQSVTSQPARPRSDSVVSDSSNSSNEGRLTIVEFPEGGMSPVKSGPERRLSKEGGGGRGRGRGRGRGEGRGEGHVIPGEVIPGEEGLATPPPVARGKGRPRGSKDTVARKRKDRPSVEGVASPAGKTPRGRPAGSKNKSKDAGGFEGFEGRPGQGRAFSSESHEMMVHGEAEGEFEEPPQYLEIGRLPSMDRTAHRSLSHASSESDRQQETAGFGRVSHGLFERQEEHMPPREKESVGQLGLNTRDLMDIARMNYPGMAGTYGRGPVGFHHGYERVPASHPGFGMDEGMRFHQGGFERKERHAERERDKRRESEGGMGRVMHMEGGRGDMGDGRGEGGRSGSKDPYEGDGRGGFGYGDRPPQTFHHHHRITDKMEERRPRDVLSSGMRGSGEEAFSRSRWRPVGEPEVPPSMSLVGSSLHHPPPLHFGSSAMMGGMSSLHMNPDRRIPLDSYPPHPRHHPQAALSGPPGMPHSLNPPHLSEYRMARNDGDHSPPVSQHAGMGRGPPNMNLDPPMFDNSDDEEFPGLVIDVPQ